MQVYGHNHGNQIKQVKNTQQNETASDTEHKIRTGKNIKQNLFKK